MANFPGYFAFPWFVKVFFDLNALLFRSDSPEVQAYNSV